MTIRKIVKADGTIIFIIYSVSKVDCTRLADGLDGEDDAVHLDNAHGRALVDGAAVGTEGLPVVTIDGDAAITAGLDGLTHPTLLANHGLGIAQALAVRFMQLPEKCGTHQQEAQDGDDCKRDDLDGEVGSASGYDGGYGGTDGKAQDEAITR